MDRRFKDGGDVVEWIKVHVPNRDAPDGPEAAARWWACYRYTEALIDDTVRHIAWALMEGVGPFGITDVDERVENWSDIDGNTALEGGNVAQIDDEIEEDLRSFFNINK